MTKAIIGGLPQPVQEHIEIMHKNDCPHREIHEWLLERGYAQVTYGMTAHWCRSHFGTRDYPKRIDYIEPAATYEERLRQYVDAMIAAKQTVYTLNRISIRGPVWGACTLTLKQAGMIAPDNRNGERYRLLVSFDNLRKWQTQNFPEKFIGD